MAGSEAPANKSERRPDLLERCASRLAEQGLLGDGPFDLDAFTAQLARRRDRPIHLTPIWLPSDDESTVCGVCISTARADHVFYAQSFSRLHRTHHAVHELAHLIFDHRSVAPLARPTLGSSWVGPAQRSPPRLGALQHWLGGVDASYSEQAEDEADAAAAILLSRGPGGPPTRGRSSSSIRAGALRLAAVFG